MGKSHMSASGLKKFRDCPKAWWFRYESDVEPMVGETKYLDLGLAVHDTLEDVLSVNPPPEWDAWDEWETEQHLRDCFEQRYEHTVTDDLKDTARQCLSTAADYLAKRSPRLIGVEVEKEYQIDRPDVQSNVKAKMDVCTDTEIWDWKTGSIRDDTPEKEMIQGAVYMAAYDAAYGEAPEKIRFVYLKEEKVRSIEPSDENWSTMLAVARSLVKAKSDGDFKAKPGDQCYWCDYSHVCGPGGGVGVEFDWEAWTRL